MLLAVDIGNTNIVIAIYDGNDFIETFRIYSDEKKTSDEYMVILETLIRESVFATSLTHIIDTQEGLS